MYKLLIIKIRKIIKTYQFVNDGDGESYSPKTANKLIRV